jgi:hypothetical protein
MCHEIDRNPAFKCLYRGDYVHVVDLTVMGKSLAWKIEPGGNRFARNLAPNNRE